MIVLVSIWKVWCFSNEFVLDVGGVDIIRSISRTSPRLCSFLPTYRMCSVLSLNKDIILGNFIRWCNCVNDFRRTFVIRWFLTISIDKQFKQKAGRALTECWHLLKQHSTF